MDYYKIDVKVELELTDILLALMSSLPFETFVEKETGFEAYIPVENYINCNIDQTLCELKPKFEFSFEKELIPYKNWNVLWESNFHPVIVDDFCGIRASFHPPFESVKHELVINPKMAFGTGHHETTFMVIQMMKDLPLNAKTVLDFGCGTGILGILASKLGAKTVVGVDIENEAIENARENCEINLVKNIKFYRGDISAAPLLDYEIALANINRNIILQSLSSLARLIQSNGTLIISGFIPGDEDIMTVALHQNGFELIGRICKNNWLAMHCLKRKTVLN
jgi:ribosomal protein L11 methyltransferase